MKSWTFETTSTSPKKSFSNDNQGVHDNRVQMEVDRLSQHSLAMPRGPDVPHIQLLMPHIHFQVEIPGCLTAGSGSVGGCLTVLSIFTDQDSKSDQTLHRVPPHLPHLGRPQFLRESAQRYGLAHVFTVFVLLTTFFLRSSSYPF